MVLIGKKIRKCHIFS